MEEHTKDRQYVPIRIWLHLNVHTVSTAQTTSVDLFITKKISYLTRLTANVFWTKCPSFIPYLESIKLRISFCVNSLGNVRA
jgi:hypothetical protein